MPLHKVKLTCKISVEIDAVIEFSETPAIPTGENVLYVPHAHNYGMHDSILVRGKNAKLIDIVFIQITIDSKIKQKLNVIAKSFGAYMAGTNTKSLRTFHNWPTECTRIKAKEAFRLCDVLIYFDAGATDDQFNVVSLGERDDGFNHEKTRDDFCTFPTC